MSGAMHLQDETGSRSSLIENILYEFSPSQQSKLSVLVVDDSSEDFLLLKRCLGQIEGFSFDIAHASTPGAAKELIRTIDFDLVFVDYWLGVETGINFLQDLGGRQSECPLVLLSGMTSPDIQHVAMKSGAIGCIGKSDLNPDVVETTIRYSLHTHQLERKLMRTVIELNRVNREKSRLFSNIRAELTGPIQSIVEQAAVIQPDGPTGHSRSIAENARRLGTVVENIVEYAFGDEDEKARDYVATDIREIIEEAIEIIQPEFVRKNQDLVVVTADDPLIARLEHASFRQAVVNILSNANKFSPAGGIVHVMVASEFHRVKVGVRDNGIGMSNREVTVALQPLGRVQLSEELAQPGVGIGLTVVKAIMKRHGGRLDIASTPNHGTRVELVLPQLISMKSDSGESVHPL